MGLCGKCGASGPLICEDCTRILIDRVIEDDRRSRGDLGFKPLISEDGADLVGFVLEMAGTAVNELHAAAAAATGADPEAARRARKAADELFAAWKKAKDALAHGIVKR